MRTNGMGEPVNEVQWPLGNVPAGPLAGTAVPAVIGVGDLRTANAAAVLATIRSAREAPRVSEVAAVTKLSRPTVEVIVEDLLASGLIEDAPMPSARGQRSPGRPARRLRFRPQAAYVVGVDVRAGSVSACIADLTGQRAGTVRHTVARDVTGAERAKAVSAVVAEAMAEAKVRVSRVCAATVGTPGWVQDNRRVRYVTNLRDWADVDIVGILGAELRCPVAVENDANLGALGERAARSAATADDMIFLLLGERLRAGIITGGRLMRGFHGAAGEVGFMVFPDGSPLAARAIGDPGAARPGINPRGVFADADAAGGAAAGDPASVEMLHAVGVRIAEAMAPVLLTLDPAEVVLGSSLFAVPGQAAATDAVLGAAAARSADMLVDQPIWRLSQLGDEAVLAGAVEFALAAAEQVLATRPTNLLRR